MVDLWSRRSTGVKILIVMVVLGVIAGGTWFTRKQFFGKATAEAPVAQETQQPPTFESPDHSVQLRVPDGAITPGTRVQFVPLGAEVTADLNQTARGVTAASTPVDIQVTGGSLAPGQVTVTLTYDLALIPQGLTAQQVGLAVFDTNLGSWVPILNAEADPATHTVTGIGPHFSWFSAIVLDPLKAVVDFGGKVVKTVIDATVTILSWTVQLAKDLTVLLIKDLLGIPPELTCNPTSQDATVTTKSMLDLLKGCAQPGEGTDVSIRLRNGFSFPLRTGELPAGTTLRSSDVLGGDADLVSMARNVYWMTQNRLVLSGTAISGVTATSELGAPATIEMDMDPDAIAFDVVLAVFLVIAPEVAAAKSALKASVESAAKNAAKVQLTAGWAKQTYDTLDCVVKAHHTDPASLFGKDGVEAQARLAHDCLASILGVLHLDGALADLIGTVKVIPEMIQTILYPIAGSVGEQLGVYKQEPPTVTIERNQINATFVGHWGVHGAQVDIYKNATGKATWNAGPCTSILTDKRHCWGSATLTFKTAANGATSGTFGEISYTTDGQQRVSDYAHAATDFQPGQTFSLARNDEHTLIVGTGGPGNPYLCDEYAMMHNNSTYNLCGA